MSICFARLFAWRAFVGFAPKRFGGAVLSRGEHAPGVPFLYVRDPDGYVIEIGNPEG